MSHGAYENLQHLLAQAEQARKEAEAELLRMHPPGSLIHFSIRRGQRNSSTGTVSSAGFAPGCLRVKHHEAKEYSRYSYRDVHYSDIWP